MVLLLWFLLVIVEWTDVKVRFLAVHHGVESVVLVRRILDRPDGAVRFHQRVESVHYVAGPRLVLTFHVTRVWVVHVVVERIVHRLVMMVLVFLLCLWCVMAVQLRHLLLLPVGVVAVRLFVTAIRLGLLLVSAVRQTL